MNCGWHARYTPDRRAQPLNQLHNEAHALTLSQFTPPGS